MDYYNLKKAPLENVSGLEKRLSRLLGFANYNRQPLAGLPYSVAKVDSSDPRSAHTWTMLKDGSVALKGSGTTPKAVDAFEELGLVTVVGADTDAYRSAVSADLATGLLVVVDSSEHVLAQSGVPEALPAGDIAADAFVAANNSVDAVLNATAASVRYVLLPGKKRVTFQVVNAAGIVLASSPASFPVLEGEEASGNYTLAAPAVSKVLAAERKDVYFVFSSTSLSFTFFVTGSSGQVLLQSAGAFQRKKNSISPALFAAAKEKASGLVAYFQTTFRLEGLYVVEHLLLRPPAGTATADEFLPVCIEPNGTYCYPLDPYSFRVAVILPGYSLRLRNKFFRQFVERQIRLEIPAHILPRICFVDEENMLLFEKAYQDWLVAKQEAAAGKEAVDKTITQKLMQVLNDLFTVYDQGQLADCDDDTDEANPIILGITFLGSNEPGTES